MFVRYAAIKDDGCVMLIHTMLQDVSVVSGTSRLKLNEEHTRASQPYNHIEAACPSKRGTSTSRSQAWELMSNPFMKSPKTLPSSELLGPSDHSPTLTQSSYLASSDLESTTERPHSKHSKTSEVRLNPTVEEVALFPTRKRNLNHRMATSKWGEAILPPSRHCLLHAGWYSTCT